MFFLPFVISLRALLGRLLSAYWCFSFGASLDFLLLIVFRLFLLLDTLPRRMDSWINAVNDALVPDDFALAPTS